MKTCKLLWDYAIVYPDDMHGTTELSFRDHGFRVSCFCAFHDLKAYYPILMPRIERELCRWANSLM